MKQYKPVVHEPHTIKWPNLERNTLWIGGLILGTIIVIAVYFAV